jgi:hypothetical protein
VLPPLGERRVVKADDYTKNHVLSHQQHGIVYSGFCGKISSAVNTPSGLWERRAGGWTLAMNAAPKTPLATGRKDYSLMESEHCNAGGFSPPYVGMPGSWYGFGIEAKCRGVGGIQFPVRRSVIKMWCGKPISSTRKR